MKLTQAIFKLANTMHAFKDADLDQDWAWGPHREGVRFALLGSYQELRELAIHLQHQRRKENQAMTQAQLILGQYHRAYRDLTAVFIWFKCRHL